MSDLYAELIPLSASLNEIDREIEIVTAPLREKRTRIQAQIDDVAARILGSKTAVATAEKVIASAPKIVVHEPEPDPLPHVPPRRLKLLRALARQPEADFAVLTVAMYGSDDRSKRGALSAEFSGLNKEGLVEPQGVGRFKLTRLAERVLRQENGARAQR